MNITGGIKVCPGTLKPGFSTYSPLCRRLVFNGHKVSHVLPFNLPAGITNDSDPVTANRLRISISGVQEKYSLRQENNRLYLAAGGGTHILKPVPAELAQPAEVPANEHLTMQVASQVFKLYIAPNALIFFADGTPAYITKRFDVKEDGSHCLKEDFAALAKATTQTAGRNYKYDYSYEGMAALIDQYIPAAIAAKEQFFRLVVFNYLFCNGDAHLKNFSRLDCTTNGQAALSPAYDLINTRLHVSDSDMALTEGLYSNDFQSASYAHYGFYAFDDFYGFGIRIGLLPQRIIRMLHFFLAGRDKVIALTGRSYLGTAAKQQYADLYSDRLLRLGKSLSGFV